MRGVVIFLEIFLVVVIIPIFGLATWEAHAKRLVAQGDAALAQSTQKAFAKYRRATDFNNDAKSDAFRRLAFCRAYGIGEDGTAANGADSEQARQQRRTCLKENADCPAFKQSLVCMPRISDAMERRLWNDAEGVGDLRKSLFGRVAVLATNGAAWAQSELGTWHGDEKKSDVRNDEESFAWHLKAAVAGERDSQRAVAVCYRDGRGVGTNDAEMVKWTLKSVGESDPEAELLLAECYRQGRGVARDADAAIDWYKKSAEHGNIDAKAALGLLYFEGDKSLGLEKSIEYLQVAADGGNARAQCQLGICHLDGIGVEKSVDRAFELFSRAAYQGVPEAQYRLGKGYCIGEGVIADAKTGVDWLRKAAKAGHVVAQRTLAGCYENGIGVAANKVEAMKWYRKAALAGDAEAEANLGVGYLAGNGIDKDEREAVKWLQLAAAKTNALGMTFLGICYLGDRDGLKKDEAKAAALLGASAKAGDLTAQCVLGSMYLTGNGVAKDPGKGFEILLKAASKGSERSTVPGRRVLSLRHRRREGREAGIRMVLESGQGRERQGDGFACRLLSAGAWDGNLL